MANTFKVVTFAAEPASAGTAYKMYTVAGSTTTVVLGLILTNIHSSAITVEVELVSTTGSRGGANNVTNAYPTEIATRASQGMPYPRRSPLGYHGGFTYMRLMYTF